ncbi:kelch-like protein 12 isoform X2 [Eurytemora carolleeae]|uniref:kelch-like protein 12 isoform X2 n=1 Tax=Eurytemora carolleeae TaxID=1294199 RepID=UPI000C78130B|nr:kelch-like protein 12 isoform X2 [Eurytemora carolleeae]|eukprot:XP_023332766.1 kelch-like protein 12 isoform X2 [Eurytemora affinis]
MYGLRMIVICSLLTNTVHGRIYRKSGDISKATWDQAVFKQRIDHSIITCAGHCAVTPTNCNSFLYNTTSTLCTLANLTILEEVLEENSRVMFIDDAAANSLNKVLKKETVLLMEKGVAVLNGIIFVYNGDKNKFYSNADVNWGEIKTFLIKRTVSSWTAIGAYIIVAGGWDQSMDHNYNMIDRFDGNSWTTLSNNLTSARRGHSGISISETELIMLGGFGGAGNYLMNTVENYNIEGELIETLPVMNVARSGHGCAIYNEEIYIAGGWSFTGPYSSVEVYNLNTNTWRMINDMNLARNTFAMQVLNNKLTVLGGGSIEVYDGENWIEDTTALKNPNAQFTSVVIPCK